MKLVFTLFLLSVAVNGTVIADQYPLWPRPQNIRYAGSTAVYIPEDQDAAETLVAPDWFPQGNNWCLGKKDPASTSIKPPAAAEGYRLQITEDGIEVSGFDRAGLQHGIRTLRQLVRRKADGRLYWPLVEISDAPTIHSRGAHFMLNQYPWSKVNAAAAYRFIDTLASLKYNLLVLQLDALPDYQSYPFSGEGHWPIEELSKLCRYAEIQGFEVIPALQLGGHAVWLTSQPGLEIYREKDPKQHADPPSWDDTLCPSQPEGTRLICKLMDELLNALKPRRFLLGYDEMLAGEKLCEHCRQQKETMAELYARQVNTFSEHLRGRGVEAIIWADQLLDFELRYALYGNRLKVDGPAFAAALDRKLILAPWYYGSDPAAFAVTDRYMRERGFTRFLGACMCFTGNIRTLADAIPRHGWEGGIHTFWYHIKSPALQSVSTYVWNNLPIFADAMWNAGRSGNPDRINRLNLLRPFMLGTGPEKPIPPEHQRLLSGTTGSSHSVTTANGVEVALDTPRNAAELNLNADNGCWEQLYLAVSCDAPEQAEKLNSPTDYEGCTTFPEVGSVDFEYADGSNTRVPLQYNWNIMESTSEREIFAAETVFSDSGREAITAITNPHPRKPLLRVVLRKITPATLHYRGATAIVFTDTLKPEQEGR